MIQDLEPKDIEVVGDAVQTERHLASVQRIVAVEPIEGADRIERVIVLGWECVAKKGEFQPGDLCVYFEIDSILPPHEVFDFMEERKYRVRTIKLRKQIAQGLAMPWPMMQEAFKLPPLQDGSNVTGLIGVLKHDPQTAKERNSNSEAPDGPFVKALMRYPLFRYLRMKLKPDKRRWPSFITKTDEERIQNIPRTTARFSGRSGYITEKLDGQSASYSYRMPTWFDILIPIRWFYVCSRNMRLIKIDNSSYWIIAGKYGLCAKTRSMKDKVNGSFIIQGEIIGYNIQGNKYGLPAGEYDFYVYNMRYTKGYKLSLDQRIAECLKLGLKHVPVIDDKFEFKDQTMDEMVELARGKSALADTIREGVVIRTIDEDLSFKSVSPDFLLKHGD